MNSAMPSRRNHEDLPFRDAYLDVIIDLESSHQYSDIRAFSDGVCGALAAGGHVSYATLLPVDRMTSDLEHLRRMGFRGSWLGAG